VFISYTIALLPGTTGNEAIAIPTGKFLPAEDEEGPFVECIFYFIDGLLCPLFN